MIILPRIEFGRLIRIQSGTPGSRLVVGGCTVYKSFFSVREKIGDIVALVSLNTVALTPISSYPAARILDSDFSTCSSVASMSDRWCANEIEHCLVAIGKK